MSVMWEDIGMKYGSIIFQVEKLNSFLLPSLI